MSIQRQVTRAVLRELGKAKKPMKKGSFMRHLRLVNGLEYHNTKGYRSHVDT